MNIQFVQTCCISLLSYYFFYCEITDVVLQDISATIRRRQFFHFYRTVLIFCPIIFSEAALQTLHELHYRNPAIKPTMSNTGQSKVYLYISDLFI